MKYQYIYQFKSYLLTLELLFSMTNFSNMTVNEAILVSIAQLKTRKNILLFVAFKLFIITNWINTLFGIKCDIVTYHGSIIPIPCGIRLVYEDQLLLLPLLENLLAHHLIGNLYFDQDNDNLTSRQLQKIYRLAITCS